MATKTKKSSAKSADSSAKVTRITAKDDKKASGVSKKTRAASYDKMTESRSRNPFVALGRYFKGAWYELKQVHWPNRRATWSLTGAMIVFTAFFVLLILLLDALFKYLFELMLG